MKKYNTTVCTVTDERQLCNILPNRIFQHDTDIPSVLLSTSMLSTCSANSSQFQNLSSKLTSSLVTEDINKKVNKSTLFRHERNGAKIFAPVFPSVM